jgi:hypothetical protein
MRDQTVFPYHPNMPIQAKPGERVFASCYGFQRIYRFLIYYMIPVTGILPVVSCLIFAIYFSRMLGEGVPDDLRPQFTATLAMVVMLGVFMGLMMVFLFLFLRRRYYDTFIICDEQGILYRTGNQEKRALWEEISHIRVRSFGRLQSMTLQIPAGKISFDASMIDAYGPHPSTRRTFTGEEFVYPDGTRTPVQIKANPLAQLIYEKQGGKGIS